MEISRTQAETGFFLRKYFAAASCRRGKTRFLELVRASPDPDRTLTSNPY